jgi:hypothetical protein
LSLVQLDCSSSCSPCEHDVAARAVAKEEKEWLELDELEKLLLSNLCGEILEEVMDTNSEHNLLAHIVVSYNRKGKENFIRIRNERNFLE